MTEIKHETGRRRLLQGALAGAALAMPAIHTARAAKATLRYCNVESDPHNVAFLKQLAVDYEKQTGVRLEVETIVGTTLWTKVTTAIKTGRPYDIIDFAQPVQTVLLAQQNQLIPVTSLINELGMDDFNPVTLVKYKNDQWYFPYILNFCYLYYRKDWLDEAKLGIPTNWAEFAEATKAITDSTKRRFGTALPYSRGMTPWANSGFLWAGGVKFYDDQWNVLLDSPEIKPKLARTLEMLQSINQYNVPGQYNMTFLNLVTDFLTGVAGIEGETGRMIEEIDIKVPEMADKYVIAPYPAPDGGKGSVVYGGKGIGLGKTANSEAALDFMRWFVKSGKMIDFQLTLPTYMQPVQYSTYKNPKWLANPVIKKHWDKMQTMRSFLDASAVNVDALQLQGPSITGNQGMILNEEVIMHMYQNVLTKKMTVSQAIDDAADAVRKFTKKDA